MQESRRILHLSRRERQIMDVVYQSGRVTAAEVMKGIPEPPSYSAVRAMLRVLVDKGHLRHEREGPRYVYLPTVPRDDVRMTALNHLVKTFFDGSVEQTVAALLEQSRCDLSSEQLRRLSEMVEEARSEGR